MLTDRRLSTMLRVAVLAAFLVIVLRPERSSTAQVAQGATMTVLAGSVAVIRTDGSAIRAGPQRDRRLPG